MRLFRCVMLNVSFSKGVFMEAKLKKVGQVAVVHLAGQFDIGNAQTFRKACETFLLDQKVIFNMSQADFIGSTGIQLFLETVRFVSYQNQHGLQFVGAKSEFRRIIQNLELTNVQFFENETDALSFVNTSAPRAPVEH